MRAVFSHHGAMEDWEQFFAEKSRRRSAKVRRRERAVRLQLAGLAAFLIAGIVLVLVVGRH